MTDCGKVFHLQRGVWGWCLVGLLESVNAQHVFQTPRSCRLGVLLVTPALSNYDRVLDECLVPTAQALRKRLM